MDVKAEVVPWGRLAVFALYAAALALALILLRRPDAFIGRDRQH